MRVAVIAVAVAVGCGSDRTSTLAVEAGADRPIDGADGCSGALVTPALGARTPLGLTAEEFLGGLLGESDGLTRGTVTWESTSAPAGKSAVTVQVRTSGTPRYTESGPNDPALLGPPCTTWMEVDGIVTVRTEDGGLDESWPVVLRSYGPRPGGVGAVFVVDLAATPPHGKLRAQVPAGSHLCLTGRASGLWSEGRLDLQPAGACRVIWSGADATRLAFWTADSPVDAAPPRRLADGGVSCDPLPLCATHAPGVPFRSPDGCNTCWCNADGGGSCTTVYCECRPR